MIRLLAIFSVLVGLDCSAKYTRATEKKQVLKPVFSECESGDFRVKIMIEYPDHSCIGGFCGTDTALFWILKSLDQIKMAYCARLQMNQGVRGPFVMKIVMNHVGLKSCGIVDSKLNDELLEKQVISLVQSNRLEPICRESIATCTVLIPISFDYEMISSTQTQAMGTTNPAGNGK